MKRKNVLAIVLVLLMLVCCLGGCSQKDDSAAEVERLQQEIAALNAQIAELEQQIADLEAGSVSEWELTGTPLMQGSGAAVSLTAVPTRYQEGQLAVLRVMLEGQTVAELYCDWNGTAYTANVELDAADGYSYYLLLTEPDGRQEYLDLNSPVNPVDPMLVYMYSSLSTSCTLDVYDWQIGDGSLALLGGNAWIQLPQMTADGVPATCTDASLILQLDGQEIARKSLMLPVEGTELSVDVAGYVFAIPELEESSQLELWMEATLSDGQVLSCTGSSWFWFEGELIQAVG